MQFVAWTSLFLGFSWPVLGFVRSRSTDMLQASHKPQIMMPCSGTSFVTTVDLSISQHQTVQQWPSNNLSSTSWLPLGIVHFFAFAQRVFLGKGVSFVTCQQCEIRRGFTLPFWEGAGSVRRRTSENAACAPESLEHVLRKVKQLEQPAPSLLSCFPVDPGTWWKEHARFGYAVHPAQEVSMMRLQACQCHPHELCGSYWRVLAARPHCKVAPPRTRDTDNSSWLFRDSTSFH